MSLKTLLYSKLNMSDEDWWANTKNFENKNSSIIKIDYISSERKKFVDIRNLIIPKRPLVGQKKIITLIIDLSI